MLAAILRFGTADKICCGGVATGLIGSFDTSCAALPLCCISEVLGTSRHVAEKQH